MSRCIPATLYLIGSGVVGAACLLAQDAPPPPPAPTAPAAHGRAIIIRGRAGSYLGIGVAEIDAERAKALKLKEAHGVEVKSVDPESPASTAGLKEGDVVLEYNGQRIEGTEQFIRMVRETPRYRQVKLDVWRNGETVTLTATIAQRADIAAGHEPDADGAFTIQIPPVPDVPPIPEMPPMPDVWRSTRSAMMGIECESLTTQLAAFFGVKDGVLVRSVGHDSAAERAGMRAGDVVVKVDGEAVTNAREITSLMRGARFKRTFPVIVVRDKKEVILSVTLGN